MPLLGAEVEEEASGSCDPDEGEWERGALIPSETERY